MTITPIPVTIGAFVCGNGLGWTSPALPGIQEQITHKVNDEEASWIGSLFTIGCFISSMVSILCVFTHVQ